MIQAIDTVLSYLWPAVMLMFAGTILLLPLALVRNARGFVGATMTLFSFLLAFAVWLWGLLVVFIAWGWWGVLIGLLLLGVGVVPMGFAALMLDGAWSGFWQMLAAVLLTWGTRYAGGWMAEKAVTPATTG